MREIMITSADTNRRLDKFLLNYMNKSAKSFIYKMLRTKKIKLNKKRADGSELLADEDIISIFLPEETIVSLMEEKKLNKNAGSVSVVYEDEHILICDKPPGVLSHPEKPADNDTMIDRVLCYLSANGSFIASAASSFTPALCNRLDRNTGGLVICGKTLHAVQALNLAIKNREVEKLYCALVRGVVSNKLTLDSGLVKDAGTNKVTVGENNEGKRAVTLVTPIKNDGRQTLLMLQLITGRTHQLRAQLADSGHPIIGDVKYGGQPESKFKGRYRLYAYQLTFNTDQGLLSYLSGTKFSVNKPEWAK